MSDFALYCNAGIFISDKFTVDWQNGENAEKNVQKSVFCFTCASNQAKFDT